MFNFNDNTSGLFTEFGSENCFSQDRLCPKCGTSLNYVLSSGVVGCAGCYKVFETEIRANILQKQGSINHTGKISSKHFSKIKIKEKIEELELEKDKAAENEDYIMAESLKNQIEKLKGEL